MQRADGPIIMRVKEGEYYGSFFGIRFAATTEEDAKAIYKFLKDRLNSMIKEG